MSTPVTSSSGRLQSRVCIVTGASSGLGRAISLAFAHEGARVVCADISPSPRQANTQEAEEKATHELIEELGGKAVFVETDVGKADSVETVVQKAVEWGGENRLDVMVNNAGINTDGAPVWDYSEEHWDQTQRVNAKGVFLGCKYASKQMMGQSPRQDSGDRGWIVNTASVLGLVGHAGTVAYAASKGAVVNLTRAIALELGQHRIHCNAVCPGFTQTAMLAPLKSDATAMQHLSSKHPFRGLGEPEDIARAVVFLASDDARWVTGIAMPVDGGYTAA